MLHGPVTEVAPAPGSKERSGDCMENSALLARIRQADTGMPGPRGSVWVKCSPTDALRTASMLEALKVFRRAVEICKWFCRCAILPYG